MYKCSILECDNETAVWYCTEHIRFLNENKTYKAYICRSCQSIIRLEKADKMIVDDSEKCIYCQHNAHPFWK
jgi:hypothetical protein